MAEKFPDTIRSRQQLLMLLAISEGTIQEINDIYFNEVSIQGFDVAFAYTYGSTTQGAIRGFDHIGGTPVSAGELTKSSGGMILGPFNQDVDFIDISISMPSMYIQLPSGNLGLTGLDINVYTSTSEFGGFSRRRSAREVSTSISDAFLIDGYAADEDTPADLTRATIHKHEKSVVPYTFTVRVEQPDDIELPAGKWRVKLVRKTADTNELGTNVPQSTTNISYQPFSNTNKTTYAGTALAAIRFEDASEVNNQVPNIALKGKGMKFYVPNSTYYDADARTYTGSWDGTFTPNIVFTKNLSWILYNLLSDKLIKTIPINSAGTSTRTIVVGFGIPEFKLAKYSFDKFARYCDTSIHGEKRYSLNGQSIERQEAADFFDDILTIANAQLSEIDGLITVSYDHELTESEINNTDLFINQNVIDGLFVYSGAHIKERYTQVNITFQDKDNFNKTKTAIVTSIDLMNWLNSVNLIGTDKPYKIPTGSPNTYFLDKFGYNTVDVPLKYTTSETQAIRKGRMILWESLLNNEYVSFATTFASAALYRGKIIRISDSETNNVTSTGRIVSYSSTGSVLTLNLDRPITLPVGTSYIYFYQLTDNFVETPLDSLSVPHQDLRPTRFLLSQSDVTTSVVTIATSAVPKEQSIFVVENSILQTYTVVSHSIEDGKYQTSCVRYDVKKFNFVDGDYTPYTNVHSTIKRLTNNPVVLADSDFTVVGNPTTKGYHIINKDNVRINGVIQLRWEHNDSAVKAAGETVYYEVRWRLSTDLSSWKRDTVGTKFIEIDFTTPIPIDTDTLNDGSYTTLPADSIYFQYEITAKSNLARPSPPKLAKVFYQIDRSNIPMVNSGATDDL